MRNRLMFRTPLRAVAYCVVVCLLVVGCTGGDDDDGGGGPRGSDREALEADVRAAHEAAEQARIASSAAPLPDPELPALAETHTGEALAEWVRVTTRLQTLGLAMRYPAGSQRAVNLESVQVNDAGDQAELEVCTVSDGEVFMVAADKVVSSGLRTVRTAETMARRGETWRLAVREVVGIETGATCGGG